MINDEALKKIIKALRFAPAGLNRNTLRTEVLANQMAAADFSALRDSEEVKQLVDIDYLRVTKAGNHIETWRLKAKQADKQTKTVKSPVPEPPVIAAPEIPAVVAPLSGEPSLTELIDMPYSAFLLLPWQVRRRLPRRNGEPAVAGNDADLAARLEAEKNAWPLKNCPAFSEPLQRIVDNRRHTAPKDYFGTSQEVLQRHSDYFVLKNYEAGYLEGNLTVRTPDRCLYHIGQKVPLIVGLNVRVSPGGVLQSYDASAPGNAGTPLKIITISTNQPSPNHRPEVISGNIVWSNAPPVPGLPRNELEQLPAPKLSFLPRLPRLKLKYIDKDGNTVVNVLPDEKGRVALGTAEYVSLLDSVVERAAARHTQYERAPEYDEVILGYLSAQDN
jgi:hypothetical protein